MEVNDLKFEVKQLKEAHSIYDKRLLNLGLQVSQLLQGKNKILEIKNLDKDSFDQDSLKK